MRALGLAFLVGSVPLVVLALRHLADRDYVAGGLLVFASAAVGHLGLELVALAEGRHGKGAAGAPGEEP
jgi:hypothetical protein